MTKFTVQFAVRGGVRTHSIDYPSRRLADEGAEKLREGGCTIIAIHPDQEQEPDELTLSESAR